jgi:hypothetical protein
MAEVIYLDEKLRAREAVEEEELRQAILARAPYMSEWVQRAEIERDDE